jgi:putative hemolysin
MQTTVKTDARGGMPVKTGVKAGMTNPAATFCVQSGGRTQGDTCVIQVKKLRAACRVGQYAGAAAMDTGEEE